MTAYELRGEFWFWRTINATTVEAEAPNGAGTYQVEGVRVARQHEFYGELPPRTAEEHKPLYWVVRGPLGYSASLATRKQAVDEAKRHSRLRHVVNAGAGRK